MGKTPAVSGGGPGFTVDLTALQDVATELATASLNWETVMTTVDTAACTDTAALGAVDTWAGFSSAWSAEVQVTGQAVAELITRIEQTVAIYSAAEHSTTEHLRPR